MKDLSRRSFGKGISLGALGGLAANIPTPLARPQGEVASQKRAPKRMTTVLRELIQGPGIIDSPSIYDPSPEFYPAVISTGYGVAFHKQIAIATPHERHLWTPLRYDTSPLPRTSKLST